MGIAGRILAVHQDQIESHGGSPELRDRGLLASALERPRNHFGYEPESDLPTFAAAYGFGLAKAHPSVDGNRRVAFQAMYVFLGLNGLRIDAEEPLALMLGVASSDIAEEDLAAWLRTRSSPR